MPSAAAHSHFGLPLWLTLIVMFAIVVARAQLTYWAGRGATFLGRSRAERSGRSPLTERVGSHRLRRASHLIERYGPVAVTLSFLTVGLQTAVNLLAGVARMPFGRYLVSMLIGSAMWAVIWTVGGLGVVWAWVALSARAPYAAATVLAAAAVVAVAVIRRRLKASTPRMTRIDR